LASSSRTLRSGVVDQLVLELVQFFLGRLVVEVVPVLPVGEFRPGRKPLAGQPALEHDLLLADAALEAFAAALDRDVDRAG